MNKNTLWLSLLSLLFAPAALPAQVFWAAGYTESLDTAANGQILIQPLPDTVLAQPFDSPVQFESTMAGAYGPGGQILFYTNGCHIYDKNHEVIPGGQGLNPGEIHDMACDEYGYIAPKGASVITFRTHPNLFFLIHLGLENTIAHSVSYGPLYLTRIAYDTIAETATVLSKNEILIGGEADPFELIRHGNGNDWWLIANAFGTAEYHKILLTPKGPQQHETQSLGYGFPFPPCRWQRSLSASPSGERLVRFSSKCGAQYLVFDRCSGELSEAGFSHLENGVFGGGGSAFSEDSEHVYFSRWYRIAKAPFLNPPDTLRASYTPPSGFGGSFVHMFRDPFGRIYIAPQASEPYLHLIGPGDSEPGTAMVQFKGLRLPRRVQRTIPHYPNYALGPLAGSPCDTLMITSVETIPSGNPGLRLYPNPARHRIRIDMGWEGAKQLVLLDALGRELRRLPTSSTSVEMELGGLPKGLYFIQAFREGRRLGALKFLKH